jgi:hypothetical protein
VNVLEFLECQELLQKLTDRGYGKFVEVMLLNENRVYTKRGRPNKSGMCRVMSWKPKQLEDALQKCREILEEDMLTE